MSCNCGGPYFGAHASNCSSKGGGGGSGGGGFLGDLFGLGSGGGSKGGCSCGGYPGGTHATSCNAYAGKTKRPDTKADRVLAREEDQLQKRVDRQAAEDAKVAVEEAAWNSTPNRINRGLDRADAVLGWLEGKANREARAGGGGKGWWKR